jgi:hypothetical protein
MKKTTRTTGTDKLEVLALTALYKTIREADAKEVSSKIPTGENKVDILVRITGTLDKGKDFEQRVVAKAQPWDIISVLMSKLNGVTLESVIKESLTVDPDKVTEIKEGAKEAMSELKQPTLTKMNGRVSPHLNVEIL